MALNKEELKHRWSSLQEKIALSGADAMLITSNINIFYVSGMIFSGAAYVPVKGDAIFFMRRPVGVVGDNVVYIRKWEDIAVYFQNQNILLPKILLTENDSVSYNEYRRLQAIFPDSKLENATPLIRATRALKSDYEIDALKRSAKAHTAVYEKIPAMYESGMTDLDLSIEIERETRKHGSLGIFRIFGQSMEIFMGSVIAGDNADTPSPYDFALGGGGLDSSIPIGCNGTLLKEGMSVMVDVGGNFTGYMTDMSRTFSIGKLTDLAYHAHQVSINIQSAVAKIAAPGVEAKELYNTAFEIAKKEGLEDYFMGHRQKAGFVGHGIGLEVNELPVLAPRSRDILAKGMVFALEPKFVIPGVGAVGIENSFCVTDNGVDKITLCNEEIISLV